MIKFIYFDFGAVLVNYDEVFKRVCTDFNLDRDEFKNFYDGFVLDMDVGKESVSGFWRKSVENFGLKNALDYNLARSWVSDYKVIQPVFDMICSLEGKVDMGIISNIHADVWWAAFEDNWVPKVKYKEILLSSDLGVIKPSKDIYEIAQEKANVKAEEILFIDDKEENLIEPKKMGWKQCFLIKIKLLMGLIR
jgi:putative hydrolase of the HAD superfamily